MNKKVLYYIFIWTFVILYASTALISCIHAIDFFSIGNVSWMSIMLACVFEIGQATVLASLLLSENKNKLMPWLLMIILTTVQVIGNVYSCFKFISLSDINYYQYLQKPLLFWINGISQETVMIIISYIIGALLPIVALCMTTMVANNIKLINDNKLELKDDDNIIINNDNVQNDLNLEESKDIKNEINLPNKDEIIKQAENSLKTRRLRSVNNNDFVN